MGAGLISNGTFTLGANIGEVSCAGGITGTGTPDSPVRLDETVLFEGEATFAAPPVLSESYHNFEYVRIIWKAWTTGPVYVTEYPGVTEMVTLSAGWVAGTSTSNIADFYYGFSSTGTTFTGLSGGFVNPASGNWTENTSYLKIYKIVGIRRKGGSN